MLIGVAIYYVSGADKNPEVLKAYRSIVPVVIIALVVILMIFKYIKSKKEKSEQ